MRLAFVAQIQVKFEWRRSLPSAFILLSSVAASQANRYPDSMAHSESGFSLLSMLIAGTIGMLVMLAMSRMIANLNHSP